MSERPPQPNQEGGVNSYGTDDPERQAQIEAARTAAAEERRANREKLERYVGYGLNEEDATALIEHEEMLAARRDALAAGEPEQGEADKRIRPRIYVRSLVDHTEGHDVGDWIDASQDLEDIQADIRKILSHSLHAHWTGQPAEEWAIHDQDGFGSVLLHEYESLDVVCSLGKGIAAHGLAFSAWAEINDNRDVYTLERFETAYFGDYESREAYAQHIVDELNGDDELAKLPDWLRDVVRIDFEHMVHEMETSGEVRFADHPGGVWVFNGRV
ncbi:antirestriction protein ArdA [Kribbella sp. NBC_01245]|uniref:antirestriction protein ArdA n=1 Tax=Kribbella sp. NBC_01245 TaxID=2903578 RepID=UPI002E27AF63|nr:antirestriction protein ArdA [Kribbella sp. NBC_01245]